jgi:hypothetical protein
MSAYIRKTDGVYMYVFGLPIWAPKNVEEKNIFFVHTTVLSLKTAFNLVKNTFIIPYYDIDSVKRKYFCFCQPRCYCFLGGATILGRHCSMAQIMAVTGHKSASSVAVYQRVSSKEKQAMGDRTVSSEDSCTRCTN